MRADRLLAIMLLLQRRGQGKRMTAGDLAKRLEVSVRTIYRDLEALGAAGVPVYAEPGRNGGIRILESYTADLSGLSLAEAELVPLLGLSNAFAGIALGSSLRRTETKLLMSLSDDQRVRAEQARRRIHVDLSRWWDHAEAVPHLPALVEAVLRGRRVRLRYKRGRDASVVDRTLDPLGLVVQGGTWYLVAHASTGDARIYRVSRVLDAEALDEPADVGDDFDLVAFWTDRKEDFHMTRSGYQVRVRARPWALRALPEGFVGAVPEGDGWVEAELSFGTRGIAFERLLGMGANVEVLEPDDLRAGIADAVGRMHAVYTSNA
jgi:predicted DNA-binding transcriptional regulator YafY